MLVTYPYRNNLSAYEAGGGLLGLTTVPEGAIKFAQQTPLPPASAKKLARQATKRPFWTILPTLGEYFRAIGK